MNLKRNRGLEEFQNMQKYLRKEEETAKKKEYMKYEDMLKRYNIVLFEYSFIRDGHLETALSELDRHLVEKALKMSDDS